MQASRADSAQRARLIIETTAEAFVAIDERGTIIDWNPAAARLFGWTPEEAVGQPLGDLLIPAEQRAAHSAGMQRYLATREARLVGRRIEIASLTKSGAMVDVELAITALETEDGIVFNAFMRDITARKLAERRLEGYAQELRDADAQLVQTASLRSDDATAAAIQRILQIARDRLGMELAHVSEFDAEGQVMVDLCGAPQTFGVHVGARIERDESYCRLVASGAAPGLVPDARGVASLAAAGIGAYAGVPIPAADGRVRGTLCAWSALPKALDPRDMQMLEVLAELLSAYLDRHDREARERRSSTEASIVQALLGALEARDSYTGSHSEAVVGLAEEVARTMGLGEAGIEEVHQCSLLHDIGKVGVPDSILHKRGPLDDLEWTVMREHPAIGARIVACVPDLAHLAPMIRAEHERWDGGGYPDGLAGDEIPLASRIGFACDAFHAMTSDRPYRKAMPAEEALAELRTNAGTQFDPAVVAALVEVALTGEGVGSAA